MDTARERNEETALVYRGAADLVHIADGERANTGHMLAALLDSNMRNGAFRNGARSFSELYGQAAQPLCPGCYMVAIFNAAVSLAKANGQSLTELGNSLAAAFSELAEGGEDRTESIAVRLDAEASL